MTVYERIESLRKSSGISQGKLEKELGFSNGSVSKWKNSMPKLERLQKVAEYFGVSIEYIMNGQEDDKNEYYYNKETATMAQQIFENKNLKVLFDAAKDASPEDLKTTHDMLMALKKKERGDYDD